MRVLALSISLSGQQPISTEDGRFWIVYNGEIFNHHELRLELEAKGHRFETNCDTEVFLHLYEEEGPACLQRLNGQFAVAIWDSLEQGIIHRAGSTGRPAVILLPAR